MKKSSKIALINLANLIAVVFAIDIGTYFFLPRSYVYFLHEWRADSPPNVEGRLKYPKGYFVKNVERGFDIGKNRVGLHWVDGFTYPIWSNSLGCFDDEHNNITSYVYFAGDSYTWGYTPYEQKFGTIIERNTNATILKCGVTHTGQLHQISKLTEIAGKLGRNPRAVFVFYAFNDLANDFAHPHTTVIDGWQVDTIRMGDGGNLVRIPYSKLEKMVIYNEYKNKIEHYQENKTFLEKFKKLIKHYSFSINILHNLKIYISDQISSYVKEEAKSRPVNYRGLNSFYSIPLEKNGNLWYLNNPRAKRNKDALLHFKKFSEVNGSQLIIVLIPPKERYANEGYYSELKSFLTENKIEFFDLASEFAKAGFSAGSLYWKIDGHFNPAGNRAVAEILMRRFPKIFGGTAVVVPETVPPTSR